MYPNPEFFAPPGGDGSVPAKGAIKARIERIVFEVNHRYLPYQKIQRVTVLDEPMEMTTTKKIKRDCV